MKKETKDIEDLFRLTFEDYKVNPSENLWQNINHKLKWYRFIHSGIAKLLGVLGVALAAAFIFYLNNSFVLEHKVEINNNHKSTFIVGNAVDYQDNKAKINIKNKPVNKYNTKQERKIELNKKNRQNSRKVENTPVIMSKSIRLIANTINDSLNMDLNKQAPPLPIFSLETREGCAPFTVKVHNLSKSAVSYFWDFGDGSYSKEANPSHTYRYSGNYKITLKAIGKGGVAISYIDSIMIHKTPNAKAEWPYENEILTNQQIQIPNYSKNMKEIEWNFGDQTCSYEKIGQHIFKQKGNYNIVLKIWSESGCVDSTVFENIKVVDITDKIVFPNAFTPNINGPVSGYYNPKDIYNDVFYPKTNGKISEYDLRIYSKFGVEVFKSSDIKYGWNGYYHNRLMPEGVYVYILRGKFEGDYLFNIKGDVTLLYK